MQGIKSLLGMLISHFIVPGVSPLSLMQLPVPVPRKQQMMIQVFDLLSFRRDTWMEWF